MSHHKCYDGVHSYYIYEGPSLNPISNRGNPCSSSCVLRDWNSYMHYSSESIQTLREYWDAGLLTPNGAYADFVVRVLYNANHEYEYSSSVMPNGEWTIVDNKSLGLKILVEPGSGSRYHVIEDYYNKDNIKKVDITKEP